MNDFDFVVVFEFGVRPAVAANDFTVEFDGETVGGEGELEDKLFESRVVFDLVRFAVDFDSQNLGCSFTRIAE